MEPLALVPEEGILTVCGGKIENPEKYPSAVFHGERVYFCTESCLKVFESDPESFMAGEIDHPG
jgi:YHS domain-containing protein